MEINTNPNLKIHLPGLNPAMESVPADAPAKRPVTTRPALAITQAPATPLEGLDGEMDIPDEALALDDALGKQVLRAFGLPPPPMPKWD